MKQSLAVFLTLAIVIFVVPTALASDPVIEGDVKGLEFCPQSVCGAAIFFGNFIGKIDNRFTIGVFHVAVEHTGTPGVITGGEWMIRTRRGIFAGTISEGQITDDDFNNVFEITATLEVTNGGSGFINVSGALDHNVFPPTIIAELT